MPRGGRGGRGRSRGLSYGPTRPNYRPYFASSNQVSSTSSIPTPVSHKRYGNDLQHDAKRRKHDFSPPHKIEEVEMDLAPLPPALRGTKLYAPLPQTCVKGRPGYLAHREKWVSTERQRLAEKGIRMVNMCIVRDDGMAIDWESDVLVDPYTLEPIRPPGDTLDTAPKYKKPRVRKQTAGFYDDEIIMPNPEYDPISYDAVDQAMAHSNSIARPDEKMDTLSMRPSKPHFDPYTVDQQTQLNDLALEYLQKYMAWFDRDRTRLRESYAEQSLLSCSVVSPASNDAMSYSAARAFAGSSARATAYSGRDEIIHCLAILGQHKFLSAQDIQLEGDYDIVSIAGDQPQVILTFHTRVVDDQVREVGVDQTFLLTTSTDPAWPLQALSHQLVMRDSAWIPARLMADDIP
ncbi:hypothetical protein CYLTODRAFT_450185 [Cylindrobasidium torrendii FP15055 ss-10]|uniref:NTF2 domain-containing protein n=1 Tax=Cylindrobasidium torrendii FP15055 ss-10 TaxID=1314674 RepID=A0A0D7BNB2_9AGAR|nr:hypothetical protein CYLTODRAFT_450185 [Cylindrobasidium torrendii FP15055 ss-10]